MSTQAVICYPSSFLERPEDRSFLIELSFAKIPAASATVLQGLLFAAALGIPGLFKRFGAADGR